MTDRQTGAAGERGATLRLEDVEVCYGEVRAVDGVTLDVRAGEFFTLLGPSGSGKTTTLHVVAGFLSPTAGDVYLGGARITGMPPYQRGIGVVFQSYALFPHLTVFENIAFPLRIRTTPRREIGSRVEAALELVQLSGYGGRRIGQLSGGQQQRVAMARAIVFGPRLLLMDEPLGALDAQLRKQMQAELKRLQAQLGITVIYVTHDQAEALTMSDRLAVMQAGRVEQLGSPEEIYERPGSRFVAGFIGETNLVAARVEAVSAGEVVVTAGAVRFVARPAEDLTLGQAVHLAIRPERLVVEPDPSTPNIVKGLVMETFYSGDRTTVTVETDGGLQLTVQESTAGRETRRLKGEAVTLGWRPEHAMLLTH